MSDSKPDYPEQCWWYDSGAGVCRLKQLREDAPEDIPHMTIANSTAREDMRRCCCLPETPVIIRRRPKASSGEAPASRAAQPGSRKRAPRKHAAKSTAKKRGAPRKRKGR